MTALRHTRFSYPWAFDNAMERFLHLTNLDTVAEKTTEDGRVDIRLPYDAYETLFRFFAKHNHLWIPCILQTVDEQGLMVTCRMMYQNSSGGWTAETKDGLRGARTKPLAFTRKAIARFNGLADPSHPDFERNTEGLSRVSALEHHRLI